MHKNEPSDPAYLPFPAQIFVGCPVIADGEAYPALPTIVQRYLGALGARGEALKVAAEGRILLAKDAAAAAAEAPAPKAAPTERPALMRSGTSTASNLALLSAASKVAASAVRARLKRIARDVYGHDQFDPTASATEHRPMARIHRASHE